MTKPLSLVSATAIKPPRPLGKAGLALWTTITDSYAIDDQCGVELLMLACTAADRAAEINEAINRDGVTIWTKTGPKAHPALRDELNNKSFISKQLERLGLNQETARPVGRPNVNHSWKRDA